MKNETPNQTLTRVMDASETAAHIEQIDAYLAYAKATGTVSKRRIAALNVGNHDKSDISTDYFDVGWFVYVNIKNAE